VVDVGDGAPGHDARKAERLELEEGHRAVRIGEQHLVDGDADLLAHHRLAGDEMLFDELPREASVGHCSDGARPARSEGGPFEMRRGCAPRS